MSLLLFLRYLWEIQVEMVSEWLGRRISLCENIGNGYGHPEVVETTGGDKIL